MVDASAGWVLVLGSLPDILKLFLARVGARVMRAGLLELNAEGDGGR
jgi:hypothetical protein